MTSEEKSSLKCSFYMTWTQFCSVTLGKWLHISEIQLSYWWKKKKENEAANKGWNNLHGRKCLHFVGITQWSLRSGTMLVLGQTWGEWNQCWAQTEQSGSSTCIPKLTTTRMSRANMHACCKILNCYLFMCVTELSVQTTQPLISYQN